MYPCLQLLDDRADKTRAGCIVLISDGVDKSQFMWSHESLALTDPIRGLLRKYPVHTLGLFKADPKALHYIAKESYGTYSSITDNKDLDKNIMEALAVCLAGLKTIVAFDTCVDITSSSLEITRVDSGGYTRRAAPGSGISIGMLCAGEVKDLVVYFSYTTGYWERGYYTTLSGITARVTYKDMPGGQSSTSTNNCSVSVAVHTTQDPSLPANPCPPFPLVLQQMVRFKVVDLLIGVLQELKALKKDAGGAKEKDGVDDPVLQPTCCRGSGWSSSNLMNPGKQPPRSPCLTWAALTGTSMQWWASSGRAWVLDAFTHGCRAMRCSAQRLQAYRRRPCSARQ